MEEAQKMLLFTTKTCPNCKMAGEVLKSSQIPFEIVDAEEHQELVQEYGIMQAPSLVVLRGDEFETHCNVSTIKKYAEQNHCG